MIGRLGPPPDLEDKPGLLQWLAQLYTTVTGFGLAPGVGNGGTVTQATSKSTAVTLNRVCGQITTHNAALAAAAKVAFTVTNSTVKAPDVIVVSVTDGTNPGTHRADVTHVADGFFMVVLENISAVSRSDAVNVSFVVIKSTTS